MGLSTRDYCQDFSSVVVPSAEGSDSTSCTPCNACNAIEHDEPGTIESKIIVKETSGPDLDLLVIGAGPHALSLLTRLVDDEPDILTEKERSFIMSKPKNARSKAAVRSHLKKSYEASEILPKTLVVDTYGYWMAQWNQDFKALGISHLRSHEHMHPDPFDFQALQVWAEEQGRGGELKPMEHVSCCECRKAGYYGPFVVPGSQLFLDFCNSLVDRYVRLSDGRCITSRRVVCALGPGPAFQGMRAELPFWAHDLATSFGIVLIIGGGQTAAHLAHVALHHGSSVTICSRKRIRQKMFDVDVKFVGDKRPKMLKQFWNLKDSGKRYDFNAAIRGDETEVEQAHWHATEKVIQVRFGTGEISSFDFIWLATGGEFDLELVPIYASLMSQHPIDCVNGLPELSDDLSWAKNVPLYVMGAFAQLQLGADALNLAGARSGSVRVARALLDEGLVKAQLNQL
eukprot:GSChrysophyteH2.ASY1.ANO1.1359.1 assembled CDS